MASTEAVGPPSSPRRLGLPEDEVYPFGQDTTLVDVLDRVLDRGVVVTGDIVLSVADVDLVHVGLRLVVRGLDSRS